MYSVCIQFLIDIAVVKRHIPCSTSFKKDFISVQFANLQIRQWILAQVTQGKRATDAVAWVVTVGSLSSNFHRLRAQDVE